MSRIKHAQVVLASALLCVGFAVAQTERGDEQRRIREIHVVIGPVYTEEQAESSSWEAFVNRSHILTRESVIRTKLLFDEGDVLDEELLAASERQLRRFKFLNASEIKVIPIDEQTVDVEVRTKDAWSLEPGANFEGGGGLAKVSAHLIEFNLLGYGKKLFAEGVYENDVGTTWKFGYSDYQLFGSRWVGNARYTSGPLIESFLVQARKPLYSLDSEWSYGGSVSKADSIIRLFEDGDESSRLAKDQTQLSTFVKRSFGPRFRKKNLTLKLKYLKADYSALGEQTTTPLPPDQENLTPTIGVSTGNTSFAKNSYIDKMGIVEDQWLGQNYGGSFGYGIPLGDSIELWDLGVFYFNNRSFSHQQLLRFYSAVSSEVTRNKFVNVKARYYKKFKGHTLATHYRMNLGYDLDSSRQFQLGADSGLRGYPARAFAGDSLALINLEDRQFWGEFQLGPKIALGTVVFVDTGNVWQRNEDFSLSDLNWSAGFGFRIGMSNLPKQPIGRIDFGWPIGESGFALTVGAEQQF
jgi:outer membrane protein assembly factor BamA